MQLTPHVIRELPVEVKIRTHKKETRKENKGRVISSAMFEERFAVGCVILVGCGVIVSVG